MVATKHCSFYGWVPQLGFNKSFPGLIWSCHKYSFGFRCCHTQPPFVEPVERVGHHRQIISPSVISSSVGSWLSIAMYSSGLINISAGMLNAWLSCSNRLPKSRFCSGPVSPTSEPVELLLETSAVDSTELTSAGMIPVWRQQFFIVSADTWSQLSFVQRIASLISICGFLQESIASTTKHTT